MTSALNNQRNNTLIFLGTTVLALALCVLTGFTVKSMLSGDVGDASASEKACTATIRTFGYTATVKKDGSIQASLLALKNIEGLVYKSGVIMASCPTYTVHDYCAGAGCLKSGVVFTLKPKEL